MKTQKQNQSARLPQKLSTERRRLNCRKRLRQAVQQEPANRAVLKRAPMPNGTAKSSN